MTKRMRSLGAQWVRIAAVLSAAVVLPLSAGSAETELSGKVNVNTATAQELVLLPGVGEARALAVIEERKRRGGFKTVDLPENINQVILAPDGDERGQAVIEDAAIRLIGQGREVRKAKLPIGKDWVNVLDDYEERAGIWEFDSELIRSDAEAQARREVIDG